MTATLFVTGSGRSVDIFAPRPEDIDFDDVAEALAKEPRFNGGTPGHFYSVAQHLVLGADFILADSAPDPKRRREWLDALATGKPVSYTEDTPWWPDAPPAARLVAAYYLAHDFHEYVLKDETTPKKRALDRVAQEFGAAAGAISDAYARLTARWDHALHRAAGLDWPLFAETREKVEAIDRRMLLTEWAVLHKGHTLHGDYSGTEPLPVAIQPWSWDLSQEMLADRMGKLLPACRVRG